MGVQVQARAQGEVGAAVAGRARDTCLRATSSGGLWFGSAEYRCKRALGTPGEVALVLYGPDTHFRKVLAFMNDWVGFTHSPVLVLIFELPATVGGTLQRKS